jgi:hypothetical protein
MYVGLEARAARSPKLMALAVRGVVKTNEGSAVKPSIPPTVIYHPNPSEIM